MDIEIPSDQLRYIQHNACDRWEPLYDFNNKSDSKPESFIRIIVQLVPEGFLLALPSAFSIFCHILTRWEILDWKLGKNIETIRILPEIANYKEQYLSFLSKKPSLFFLFPRDIDDCR